MTSYDDDMRTIIDLPQDQLDALDELSRRDAISRAEAVRRAVTAYVIQRRPPERVAEGFGLWKGRTGDGRAYEDRLRREWTRDAGRL